MTQHPRKVCGCELPALLLLMLQPTAGAGAAAAPDLVPLPHPPPTKTLLPLLLLAVLVLLLLAAMLLRLSSSSSSTSPATPSDTAISSPPSAHALQPVAAAPPAGAPRNPTCRPWTISGGETSSAHMHLSSQLDSSPDMMLQLPAAISSPQHLSPIRTHKHQDQPFTAPADPLLDVFEDEPGECSLTRRVRGRCCVQTCVQGGCSLPCVAHAAECCEHQKLRSDSNSDMQIFSLKSRRR